MIARPKPSDLLPLDEVRAILNVSRNTMYRMVREEKLPAYRVGQRIKVRRDDLEKFLRNAEIGR